MEIKLMEMQLEKARPKPTKVEAPHHSGKGTRARLNTAAEKHIFNQRSSK